MIMRPLPGPFWLFPRPRRFSFCVPHVLVPVPRRFVLTVGYDSRIVLVPLMKVVVRPKLVWPETDQDETIQREGYDSDTLHCKRRTQHSLSGPRGLRDLTLLLSEQIASVVVADGRGTRWHMRHNGYRVTLVEARPLWTGLMKLNRDAVASRNLVLLVLEPCLCNPQDRGQRINHSLYSHR